MNISLTPEMEDFVRRSVASGTYHSTGEVVRDALRILMSGHDASRADYTRPRSEGPHTVPGLEPERSRVAPGALGKEA